MNVLGSTLIEVPSWGHVTLIEAVWLLTGLAALVLTVRHLDELRTDYVRARSTGRPVFKRIALGYYRRELVRLMAGAVITAIGVYAALQPPAMPGPARTTPVGLLITAGFIAIAAFNALASWWDWSDRDRIQSDLERGFNGHHKPMEEQ